LKPETLYTIADVKRVRIDLADLQNNKCALTKIDLEPKDSVLDHNHKTNYVRAVLHRQANAVLGKIENMHGRYLAWWYPGTLADFLRQVADYLDTEHSNSYVHPGWIKSIKTQFNKLKSAEKDRLLIILGSEPGNNDKVRKDLFSKIILKKQHDYVTMVQLLDSVKDEPKGVNEV
jgi:hypothetical protein